MLEHCKNSYKSYTENIITDLKEDTPEVTSPQNEQSKSSDLDISIPRVIPPEPSNHIIEETKLEDFIEENSNSRIIIDETDDESLLESSILKQNIPASIQALDEDMESLSPLKDEKETKVSNLSTQIIPNWEKISRKK